jgi:hypothetical protein
MGQHESILSNCNAMKQDFIIRDGNNNKKKKKIKQLSISETATNPPPPHLDLNQHK